MASATSGRQIGATKPGPTPSILWLPGAPPDSTADSDGSTAMTCTRGCRARRPRATPVMHCAVPTDCTKASRLPPVWAHSSWASEA